MYSIKVESFFSSAHNLRSYKGKCEALHGHNWKVEAVVAKKKPDQTGMVLDFNVLKMHLNKVLEGIDHKYLNDITYFKKQNPTSENIAKFIYENLKSKIKPLKSVTVWESNTSSSTYEK